MGVARDAGANIRDNASKLDIGQIISDAAHNAIHTVAQQFGPAIVAAHAAPVVNDFVTGLMQGRAPALPAAQVKNAQAAAPKAAAPAGPQAPKFTQAQLDAMPNAVQQWAADHPNEGAASGGSSGAAAPRNTGGPSSLDVVRAAAMANGGLSLNQLGSLSESMARVIPPSMQRPQTAKDAVTEYAFGVAQQRAQAEMAAAKQANDPAAYKKATDDLFENLRSLSASPNQMYDVNPQSYNQ